jgi:hypothetical protein
MAMTMVFSKAGVVRVARVGASFMAFVVAMGIAVQSVGAQSSGVHSGKTPSSSAQASELYGRYVTPGWCQAALTRLTTIYWRDKRPDTVTYAPLTDSIPTSVKQTLASCASRFTVENTPDHELVALVQLDLTLGRDDQARAAADRLIAMHAGDAADKRGWVILLVARSFLDAKPARLADGRRYVARLDSLSGLAGEVRMLAHVHSGEFAVRTGALADAYRDYQAAIVASKAMSRDERTNRIGAVYMMYDSASEVTALYRGAPEALRMIDSAKRELVPLRPEGTPGSVGAPLQALAQLYGAYGKKAEPLRPSHWYATNGDTIRPRVGVASLVVFGNPNCGGLCYSEYAAIRRLQAKYGAALNTTIVTGTEGYYLNNLVSPPSAESDSAGKYFLDFLKLPVAVAASEITFTRKIDGRRNPRPSIDQQNYERGRNAVLVGRDGLIKAIVNLGLMRERLISDLIAEDQRQSKGAP